jgi:hypothetical protein
VKELVEYVKKNPGLGYASSGVGSNQHVAGEWFAKDAGIKIEHVPYRGAGQAINDLIAAHVKTAFLGPTALFPHYKAGTIKLVAHTGSKRSPILPEIPTSRRAATRSCSTPGTRRSCRPARRPASSPSSTRDEQGAEGSKAARNLQSGRGGADRRHAGGDRQDRQADSVKYAQLVKELNIKTN